MPQPRGRKSPYSCRRTPEPDYRALPRRVRVIADMYAIARSETVASLYEDNRHTAIYEVDFVDDLPRHIADQAAEDIRPADDEPWWPDE